MEDALCPRVAPLAWDQKNSRGISALELAQMAVGEYSVSGDALVQNMGGDPPEVQLQHPFDPKGTLTMTLTVEPGTVESRDGEGCQPRLTVTGMANLRTSEGVLNETFPIRIQATRLGEFSFKHRFGGEASFEGTFSEIESVIPELYVDAVEFSGWVNKERSEFSGTLDVMLEPYDEDEDGGTEVEVLAFPKSMLEEDEGGAVLEDEDDSVAE